MEPKRKPGRPAGIGQKLERITITLEPADIAKARAIGAGSVSAGVRVALAKMRAPNLGPASAEDRIPAAPKPST